MLPIPSRNASIAFVGCVLALVIATLAQSPTATVLSAGTLLALGAALALTMPLGARLRRERLEFAWWLSQDEPDSPTAGVVPGVPFTVSCYLRCWSRRPIVFSSLWPVAPEGVALTGSQSGELVLAPQSRTEFNLTLQASAQGRIVLQGLAVSVPGIFGLFSAPLYFPNPLTVRVLPRASLQLGRAGSAIADLREDRSGPRRLRRQGGGMELRELREFQPGDPFKAIAWKASARTARLMVREVEREVQQTGYVILDIGPSMRAGAPGKRQLDLAVEVATTEARNAIERGDRLGLITVDGRILAHVTPGEGLQHMIRIYDALLSADEVVDQDLTETDDRELLSLVGNYVRNQEGVDFSSRQGWRKPELAAYVTRALRADAEELSPLSSLSPASLSSPLPTPSHQPTAAETAESTQLRNFCRIRGIPLAYRSETPGAAKAQGLAQALQQSVGNTRMQRVITIITDFDGTVGAEALTKPLTLARMRGHRILFLCPDATALAGISSGDNARATQLETDLYRVYSLHEQRRIEEARSWLGKLGIPVLLFGPHEAPAAVVARGYAVAWGPTARARSAARAVAGYAGDERVATGAPPLGEQAAAGRKAPR